MLRIIHRGYLGVRIFDGYRFQRLFSTVGFIGLGNMGGPMAVNLAKAGFKVHLYDKRSSRMGELRSEFMKVRQSTDSGDLIECKSLEDFTGQPDLNVVVTMLPSSHHLLEVYGIGLETPSLVAKTTPGTLFIDCTTGDPEVSKRVSEHVAEHHGSFVDAPVSGGVSGAEQATLTFMVGGEQTAVSRATPLLQAMGKQIFHCGPVGTGLAAKLCNNLLLAISMIGTSEALILGERLGLDPGTLTRIINSSSGRCWSSEVYNPVPGLLPNTPASRAYQGGFAVALIAKDLGLAQNASTATATPTPMASLAHQLYRSLCQQDRYERKDFSVVFEYLSGRQPGISGSSSSSGKS